MQKKSKGEIAILIVLIIYLAAFAVIFFPRGIKQEVSATPATRFTVVIDAGHGGIDGGAEGVNKKLSESEINLAIAFKLKKMLESNGINTVMTRTDSGGLYGLLSPGFKKRDMSKRAEIIRKADPSLVVSVHQNSCSSPSRRGSLIYYEKGNAEAKSFAGYICAGINSMPEKVRDCVAIPGDYYILNTSPCPSVIAECGFLSNAEDEVLLCDENYREKFAYALYKGIVDYLMN